MKKQLRKKYLAYRDSLNRSEVMANSKSIMQALSSSTFWENAQCIMCYLSLGNEINTTAIIEKAWKEKKQVIIPVCQNKIIKPSLIVSWQDLEPKTMGILEPKEGKLIEIDPYSIDICLIPGLAFDRLGHRIGFGAGYYDRFLPLLHPQTPKIALAHEVQISPIELPWDEHDVLMDYIITEKHLFRCKL